MVRRDAAGDETTAVTDGALAEGLSIADEQVWLRLRNHVAREKGSWFGAIFASSTYGLDELARRAPWFLGGQSRELRRIVASSPDELTAAVSDVLNGSLVGGLIWIEATRLEDSWAAAWAESLTALNRRRDTMRRELGGGLLLVGPPGLRRQLASQAVDLSSVRSFTAELAGRSMPALDITADDRVTFADVPIEVGDEVAATLRTIDRLRSSDQADAALDLAVDLLTEPLTATERIAALEASAAPRRASTFIRPLLKPLRRPCAIASGSLGLIIRTPSPVVTISPTPITARVTSVEPYSSSKKRLAIACGCLGPTTQTRSGVATTSLALTRARVTSVEPYSSSNRLLATQSGSLGPTTQTRSRVATTSLALTRARVTSVEPYPSSNRP